MLIGAVALVAALVIVGFAISVPYYAIVPGQAMPVSQLITIPPSQAHPVHGRVLLTDVGVDSLKLINYLVDQLDSNASIVSSAQLTADLPVSEFDSEGVVDMAESQLTADSVALRQLGYSVPEHDVGVAVYVIDPSSPAWKKLAIGNVITAINGTSTPNPDTLVSVLHQYKPGQTVTLSVGSISEPTKDHPVSITLASITEGGKVEPLIGIGDPKADIPGMGTQPAYDFPFQISINSDNIGGPSAGLAFTLGILDSLTGGKLTGGKVVAATGTIRPDGSVGDVGGVPQKTIAVEEAGAKLFLVPPQEYQAALSKASGGLKVMAVSTLAQALRVLEQFGGDLGQATVGPPAGPGGHSLPYDWQASPWT